MDKRYCRKGHELTTENTRPNGRCIICSNQWYQENKEISKQRATAWKKNNPEKQQENNKRSRKKYYQKNRDEEIRKAKIRQKECMISISPAYVANNMRISVRDLPSDVVQIKKLVIQLERSLRCR